VTDRYAADEFFSLRCGRCRGLATFWWLTTPAPVPSNLPRFTRRNWPTVSPHSMPEDVPPACVLASPIG